MMPKFKIGDYVTIDARPQTHTDLTRRPEIMKSFHYGGVDKIIEIKITASQVYYKTKYNDIWIEERFLSKITKKIVKKEVLEKEQDIIIID